jgi:20S proteasome alpha/beta subunit
VVSGNNTDALLGVCESMYRTGLKPEELFETISQCLLSAVNRDCLSGWGGVVHIITPTVRPCRALCRPLPRADLTSPHRRQSHARCVAAWTKRGV